MESIRVGVIGANSDRGWAASAHLPALAALETFEVRAVCTTKAASAAATAARYGATYGLTDPSALVALPDIELVVVCVRAPEHASNVRLALNAGKHVLCEWPLGTDSTQSTELLSLAQAKRVRHFVGLQGHASPAAMHARKLVRDGYLGELLSVTMVGSHAAWGAVTPPGMDYLLNAANGVSAVSIAGGHAIDMLCSLVGEITAVSGIVANRRPFVMSGDGTPNVPKSSPDQLLFIGQLASGAPLSVHIQGGVRERERFSLDLHGSEGTLSLRTDFMPEILPPQLLGTRVHGGTLEPIGIPGTCRTAPDNLAGPAINVAQLYVEIAADLRDGSSSRAPDFAQAVRRRAMVDAVARSATDRPLTQI